MADPIPPPSIEEQIAAAEQAMLSFGTSGGIVSYAIGGRQITRDWRGLRDWLLYLRSLQATAAGGDRNYASFRRFGRLSERRGF